MNPVNLFEEEFAKYVGLDARNVVAVSNGTAALISSILALKLPPHSRVATTPFTFPATSNVIILAGHKPIFVDIDDNYQLDPDKLDDIHGGVDAILPVHLFGEPCKILKICEWAERHCVPVIEDCSQAVGLRIRTEKKSRFSLWTKQHVGTFGTAGTFSFYASKNLPTFEGGMVISNSIKIIDFVRQIINHGFEKGEMVELGYNFKMPWINAFLGWQHLLLHKPGIEAELGRYGIKDGYYPKLVYQYDWYRRHPMKWESYPCPKAELAVTQVR